MIENNRISDEARPVGATLTTANGNLSLALCPRQGNGIQDNAVMQLLKCTLDGKALTPEASHALQTWIKVQTATAKVSETWCQRLARAVSPSLPLYESVLS